MISNNSDIEEETKEKELEQYGVWVKAGPEEIETEDNSNTFSLSDIEDDSIDEHAITDEEEELLGNLEDELNNLDSLNLEELDNEDIEDSSITFDMPLDFEESEQKKDTPHKNNLVETDKNDNEEKDTPVMDEKNMEELELEDLELDDLDVEELELEELDSEDGNEKAGVQDTLSDGNDDDDFEIDLDEDLLSTDIDEDLDNLDVDSFLEEDDIKKTESSHETTTETSLDDFSEDSLEEVALDDFNLDNEDLSIDIEEGELEEIPSFEEEETGEETLLPVAEDFSGDFDETESIIEDLTITEENDIMENREAEGERAEKETGNDLENLDRSNESIDSATEVLKKIEDELLSIKNEILMMKEELSTLKPSASSQDISHRSEQQEDIPGFFNEDEDETIALTGDELDNILSTADITEELREGTEIPEDSVEGETSSPETEIRSSESDAFVEPEKNPLIDQPDLLDDITIEEEPPQTDDETADLLDDITIEEEPAPADDETAELLDDITIEEEPAPADDETADLLDETIENVEEIDFPEEPDLELEDLDFENTGENDNEDTAEKLFDEEESEMELFSEEPILEIPQSGINSFEEEGDTFIEDLPELEEIPDDEEVLLKDMDESSLPEGPSEPLESTVIDIEIPELQEEEKDSHTFSGESINEQQQQSSDQEENIPQEPEKDTTGNDSTTTIPPHLQPEIISVLSYMDQLLESLPEEKIEEFANSEYFAVYKKLFDELGLH